jgi:polyhydroxybutyrate depolymerase
MKHLDRKRDRSSTVSSLTATFVVSLFLISVAGCGTDEPGAAPATTAASVATSTPVLATAVAVATTEPAPSDPPPTIDPACASKQDSISTIGVAVAGQQRTALVHLPAGKPPAKPAAVVVAFHGAGDNTGRFDEWNGLAEMADVEGFVTVHPQGSDVEVVPGVRVNPGWDILGLHVDEAAFVAAVLDELASELCIDTNRVYATGISNGGALALQLACTLGDRITAVAAVAPLPISNCPNPTPTPTLIFHGLDDLFIPYGGDPVIGLPPIEQLAGEVATRNGCTAAPPDVTTVAPGIDELVWSSCTASTELYRISSEGHAWPGGHTPAYSEAAFADLLQQANVVPAGLTPTQAAANVYLSNPGIDASEEMWQFFTSHS